MGEIGSIELLVGFRMMGRSEIRVVVGMVGLGGLETGRLMGVVVVWVGSGAGGG